MSSASCPNVFIWLIEPVGRNGFADEAFKLAEDYHDFRSLASLCHKGKVYPPEENPNAARIKTYIEKFKEAFTTELYQWYIEHGAVDCYDYAP